MLREATQHETYSLSQIYSKATLVITLSPSLTENLSLYMKMCNKRNQPILKLHMLFAFSMERCLFYFYPSLSRATTVLGKHAENKRKIR